MPVFITVIDTPLQSLQSIKAEFYSNYTTVFFVSHFSGIFFAVVSSSFGFDIVML